MVTAWCAACGLSYDLSNPPTEHFSVWPWLWRHTGFFGRCPARKYEIGELELTASGDLVQH